MDYRYFMFVIHLCVAKTLHVSSPLLCHRNTSYTHSTLMKILYFMRSRYPELTIYFMRVPYFYVVNPLHDCTLLLWKIGTSCNLYTLMI